MNVIEVDEIFKKDEEIELQERVNKGFMALVWCICMETEVDESMRLFSL